MARSKPIPPGFERQGDVYRCISCLNADPLGAGRWIQKGSLQRHMESADHLNSTDLVEKREAKRLLDAQRLQEIYAMDTTSASSSFLDPSVNERTGMFNSVASGSSFIQSVLPDDFSAGLDPIKPLDPAQEHENLRHQVEQMLLQAEQDDEFGTGTGDDDLTSTNIEEHIQQLDLEEDGADEDDLDHSFEQETGYRPYPNKLMMLLDIIDNLPRLRMSGSQFQIILWLLRQLGVSRIPAYGAFRKMQKELQATSGSSPTQYTSSIGNIFYVNSIGESVMRDFANPLVAEHLCLYPEETTGPVAEVWQAGRWKEFKPSELTPMFSRGLRQFFIEEVTQLKDGSYVLPKNLIIRNKKLTSDCNLVVVTPNGWRIESTARIIDCDDFDLNFLDISSRIGDVIPWSSDSVNPPPPMPNPLRDLAGDEDLVVVMVPLWCDDVSGNKSKQYNKHINVYMANSNLPGRLLQQEYFVRFVSTSPHATSPEQFSALKDQINATHTDPIQCYNAHTNKKCRVVLRVPALPADNPQQSEESSHSGPNANCKCHRCKVGGHYGECESNEGYHAHYVVGVKRTAEETLENLGRQINYAMYGIEKPITDLQTATGVKDKIAQHWIEILLKKSREMKSQNPRRSAEEIAEELCIWLHEQPGDKVNPLLSISGLDPTQDTPVEILHTILLGIVKYVWHNFHSSWSPADQDLFTIRLQSTDIDGLNVPPIRAAYMMQYRNGLIGKHFKTLMQSLPFHAHGITSPQQFALVKAVAELGSLLWVHEIENMEQYLHDLEILVGNVLDAFGDVDPSKIVAKMKLQILPHLMDDIRRFGPAIRNSTEIFECFNAIFRLCSILSNHQAPSRDISVKFTSMDRLKHILSGGYWNPSKDRQGEWMRADEKVRQVLINDRTIQRHLGWTPPQKVVPGSVRFVGKKKSPSFDWESSQASRYCRLPSTLKFPEGANWRKALNLTSQSGDICSQGSWVFARDFKKNLIIGRISEIVGPDTKNGTQSGIATIEIFRLGGERHPDFSLPILCRPNPNPENPSHIAIHTKNIMFVFSVQHDCRTAACAATALKAQVQERQVTEKMNKLIAHTDDDHFLVNLYALHNANLLRNALPRDLYAPTPLYQDRQQRHYEMAANLRKQKDTQRAEAKKQRAAKAAKKKAKAAEAARQNNDPPELDRADMDTDMEEAIGNDGEYSDDGEEELEEAEVRRPVKRKRTA